MSKKAPARRVRRNPQASRAHILEAAGRVLAELGPDRAGLKQVATAAGVSHALVTHYFGTFSALVEEVLASRMGELRDAIVGRIAAGGVADLEGLVHMVFEQMREPVTGRLLAWAFLTGQMQHASFFAHRRKGLRTIVNAAMAHPQVRALQLDRAEVEQRVVLLWCALVSYSVAAPTLWQALGHTPGPQRDAAFEAQLVRTALGSGNVTGGT